MAAPLIEAEGLSNHHRLAQGYEWLEQLEAQRAAEQYPAPGRLVEDWVIWREILDLELQDIDEQIERILTHGTDRESGRT